MFIVTIENDGVAQEIHGDIEKLHSGKVVKGINSIDTFSFSLLPSNVGFNAINDFTTLVKVYNTNKDRYEFHGRVLYSDTTMAESGLITKDVTCESYFGYLCDSQQTVVKEQNWTVTGLLQYIINYHNSQVEEYKRFTIGEVTVTDPNNNLYKGIQYENTWDTLKDKFVDTLGGEFRFRVVNGVNYIDYLEKIGKTSETEIAVSRNMKSIKQEKDPSAYITRLIPLGMKVGENGERLTIENVNNGVKYIDDEYGIAEYGIHVGYHEWDDVTDDSNLLNKAVKWLESNNKLKIKYSITALDLSLLGLDIDDFDVCNYHPLKNPLLGIDDVARITKKSIDVCEEVKSTIEVGENFKTASDIQIEQQIQAKKTYSQILKDNELIRLEVKNEVEGLSSSIDVSLESISMEVKSVDDRYTALKATIDGVTVSDEDGTTLIKGSSIQTDTLYVNAANINGTLTADQINLSGAITWNDLDSDVKSSINSAGGISASEARTIINSTLVSSPNIAGAKFWDLNQTSWLEVDDPTGNGYGWMNYYYSEYSSSTPVFGMGYVGIPGSYDTFELTAFNYGLLYFNRAAATTCPMGKWDFTEATISNLHSTFA